MHNVEYKPSWRNTSKYALYWRYFMEYLKYGDFKSLRNSFKYLFFNRLPGTDYETKSGLGRFYVRRNTIDFQFVNYAYEIAIKDYFSKNLNDFDVFIDVGACIGEYDIWLAKQGKRCIAIEPVHNKALQKNVALNNVSDKIKTFNCGIGSKKERVYFEIHEGYTGSSHINREVSREPNVDIERLDDLSKQFGLLPGDRIIMKLDAEGMELEIIEGAREFIRSRKDICIIYESFLEDNDKIDNALKQLGDFKVENIDDANRIAVKKG